MNLLSLAAIALLSSAPAAAQSGEACGMFAFNPDYCGSARNYYVFKKADGSKVVCNAEFAAFCKERGRPGLPAAPKAPSKAPARKRIGGKAAPAAKPLTDAEQALLTDAELAAYKAGGRASTYRRLAASRAGYQDPADPAAYAALNAGQKRLFCDRWARAGSGSAPRTDAKAKDQARGAKTSADSEMEGKATLAVDAGDAGAGWQAQACKAERAALPAAAPQAAAADEPPPPPTKTQTDATQRPDQTRKADYAEEGKTRDASGSAATAGAPAAKPSARGLLGELAHEVKKFFKWLF